MGKPLVIIGNGLPGTGKTTLAKRLAADAQLPVLHKETIPIGVLDRPPSPLILPLHCEQESVSAPNWNGLHMPHLALIMFGQGVALSIPHGPDGAC